jgi:hypothetical protein
MLASRIVSTYSAKLIVDFAMRFGSYAVLRAGGRELRDGGRESRCLKFRSVYVHGKSLLQRLLIRGPAAVAE